MKKEVTPDQHHISRRGFIRYSACASVGTLSLLNTMLGLRQMNAMVANNSDLSGDDYKAIVCIFLYGGNDSANVLIPTASPYYDDYAAGRAQLTLPRESLLRLNAANDDGRDFGIHPAMGGCAELFGGGDLAFLANVGTLFAPADIGDYRNRTNAIPPHLFSHNDQQVMWQTSVPHQDTAYHPTGWGGRMGDLLSSVHNDSSISMMISLSGTNFFQVGNTMLPLRLGSGGDLTNYKLATSGSGSRADARFHSYSEILDQEYADLMEQAFADLSNRAIEDADTVNQALEAANDYDELIPDSGLGRQLAMISRLIQAGPALGLKRQVFFCATGGFDTHGPQLATHAGLLGNVSACMKGFHDALVAMGKNDEVTTFTASDFGRTFDSNGRGSDHGWGSHHMIMGGAVNGQQIYGKYPDLTLNSNPLDTGRGRWLPTTSVDQYGATLARWFGITSEEDMRVIFPNIGNFSQQDLGFMQANTTPSA